MDARSRHRPFRAAAIAVAILVALPAGGDAPERPAAAPPAAREPPAGAERIEIQVRFPPWQFLGTFRAASAGGLVADAGAARDVGALLISGSPVDRILDGGNGTLTLRLHGVRKSPGFPQLFGRWTVVRGTGAYAGLRGEGTFTSVSAGDAKGSPLEVQTLLGHVHRG